MTRLTRPRMRGVLSGLAVGAMGVFVGAIALTYPLGSAFRPGPGFFPLGIGGLMILLGLMVAAEAMLTEPATAEDDATPVWRPMAATGIGMLVFAGLLETLGYVPAAVALVGLAALGDARYDWRLAAGIALFMAIFGTAVFIWGLGLPIAPFEVG